MMYQKSKEESLTRELFQNPTNEYRGAPFWAWNQALSPEVLVRHIDYFKEMGIGDSTCTAVPAWTRPIWERNTKNVSAPVWKRQKRRECMPTCMMKTAGPPEQPGKGYKGCGVPQQISGVHPVFQ